MSTWRFKSFKSTGSFKNLKLSGTGSNDPGHEELPILFDHDQEPRIMGGDPTDPRIFPLMVEAAESGTGKDSDPDNKNKTFRQSSYEFWNDNKEGNDGNDSFGYKQRWQAAEESPSKTSGQLLNKRNNSNEIALDMDLDMDGLKQDQSVTSRDSRRVSFETGVSGFPVNGNDPMRYQTQQQEGRNERSDDDFNESTGISLQRRSGLLSRLRSTKSRLIDRPQEEVQMMSDLLGKSGPIRSGLLGKSLDIDEEEDPFADEDVPEEFRRANLNALTLLQWLSLILIVAAFLCSLLIPSLKRLYVWELKLWKWLVLVLVLICGRLVSGWGIRLIVFFIEMNFLLRKRLLYFVYGVRKPVQNCLWLGLVLVAWHFLFDKKVGRASKSKLLKYVNKILVCFLISTLLWLIKTLIVKVMASSFHVSTYFDRIQDTLFNQYVIETLSGPPLNKIHTVEEEDERTVAEIRRLQNAGATVPPDLQADAFPPPRSGKLQKTITRLKTRKLSLTASKKGDNGIGIEHLHRLNHKNISAWNMKRLMMMVRHGTLSTLDEQILDQPNESDPVKQIKSEYEATAAARKIFQNVARRGSKYIYLEDLMRFMREDEALRTMNIFEGAYEKRRISKSSLKNWVVNVYRERRALALTLNDTKTAVNNLHHMVNVIAFIIIAVIWLVLLEIASSRIILLFSSQLVVAAFIFGNTCKTIFESIIFLFIIHPFDVGDRCEIDGAQFVVEEMNILTTVFLRFDNLKITFPNSVLSTKPIGNFYRSPDMGDSIDFCIHIATPIEKVAVMKQRILSYIESRKEHWCCAPTVILKEIEGLNSLKMAVWVTHKMNYQDIGERWERRARLAEEMVNIFKELDMPFRLLPIDINVCSLPPVNSSRIPSAWTAAESSAD
ncbi:PREDICTED: mechanosensitive ion channel protein 8 [Theobroma cacao]|uniref:Mechanosensitive ion channel protein n=1 Tax=Theobroma cacao TaxID=3641 RepID=A0AB32VXP6_THECC|nr:PREDICTED: mechanosensitive ion channel protein 8 [Theobroma cacao]